MKTEESGEVKKRGRPKKEIKIISDADIINNVKINTNDEEKESSGDEMEEENYVDNNDEENDYDDDELDVSELEVNGKMYYKAENNYIYNIDGELQGYWNGKKIEIINK